MSSELVATYSALGSRDNEGNYYTGKECLACVKDLIRALREDDSSCEIRRHLGQAGILQKDLIPILLGCSDNTVLRNDVIRLLVNLTQPAYLCFGSSFPKAKESDAMKCFMEVESYLRHYKEEFTVENVMNVIGTVLAELCQKDWDEREDDDVIVIERILLLFRNILHVTPDPLEEKRTEDDVSVHDQIIWNFHVNGIDELLLFLGSNPQESQWCMYVTEIVFLIMREQSAASLASTGSSASSQEQQKDVTAVDEVLAREMERKCKAQQFRGSRHSAFGGTFVVKDQKTISGQERVYHRPLAGLEEYSYDVEKRPRRTARPKRVVRDPPQQRRSTLSIRTVLRNMSVQFLQCCYNPIMKVVKDNIAHQRAMENDETYYLWSLRFFMEFNRMHDFRVDIVGETLQLQTLHYVIQLLANYYESMLVEKRTPADARLWGQRLHYAVAAYKELLLYLQRMAESTESVLADSAGVMQSNVFYQAEYRDVFITLLRNFNEVVQTRSSLCDMVEAAHTYVRLLEHYCRTNSNVVVQEQRKAAPRKKGKRKGGGKGAAVLQEGQLVDLWERMDARVADLMEGAEPLPHPALPFDAASDVPVEEQKIEVMGRIRAALVDAQHGQAVALLRAAREVWPDDVFGAEGIAVDDELSTIKDILFNPAAALPAARLLEDGDGSEGEGGEGGTVTTTVETSFDVLKFIQRFCNNKIVRVYGLALASYHSNSVSINHAVVKMLYRIAVQLKMAPLLYQLSVFRTLDQILHEPAVPRFKELQKFARYIVAGFFHLSSSNALMFVELLFWKTSSDVIELTEGYGTLERKKLQEQASHTWSREQEEELEALFQRYNTDEDIVGCIEAALHGGEVQRSRKQISSQLVKQGLVGSRKELNKKAPTKNKGGWSEEEWQRLREAFLPMEDVKLSVQRVAEHFPDRGVRDLKRELMALGLIPSPKSSGGKNKRVEHKYNSDEEEDNQASEWELSNGNASMHSPEADSMPRRGGASRVGRLVKELQRAGLTEPLAWLDAYLSDEARDRTLDDEWEEMCIVAVGTEVSAALESPQLQALLSALGLQPPSQQERYWRIPASMSPQELTRAAACLRGEGGGEWEGGGSEEEEEEESSVSHMSRPEMTRSEALAVLSSQRKFAKRRGRLEDEVTAEPPLSKRPRLAQRSAFLEEGEESDSPSPLAPPSGTARQATPTWGGSPARPAPGKRHRVVLRELDDSSDEEATPTPATPITTAMTFHQKGVFDSDDSEPELEIDLHGDRTVETSPAKEQYDAGMTSPSNTSDHTTTLDVSMTADTMETGSMQTLAVSETLAQPED